MSKKYEPKKESGREYVDAAMEFYGYITDCMLKLPEEWADWITGPVVESARKIAEFTKRANGVYVNESRLDVDACIKAYGKRDEYLYEILMVTACLSRLRSRDECSPHRLHIIL